MKKVTWSDDPTVECPQCGREIHASASFEMGVGDQIQSSACRAYLSCVDTEVMRRWAWAVLPERTE